MALSVCKQEKGLSIYAILFYSLQVYPLQEPTRVNWRSSTCPRKAYIPIYSHASNRGYHGNPKKVDQRSLKELQFRPFPTFFVSHSIAVTENSKPKIIEATESGKDAIMFKVCYVRLSRFDCPVLAKRKIK